MAFVTHAFAFIVRIFIPVLSCVCCHLYAFMSMLSSVCFHICVLPMSALRHVCWACVLLCMLSYVFSSMCARRSLSAHILYLHAAWGLLTV